MFTSYERDAESGNDYAMARYYLSRLGRFSAVDPLSGSTGDPQSLNRYAYVRNSPMEFTDPLGMTDCPQGKSCGDPWNQVLGSTDLSGLAGFDILGGGSSFGPGNPGNGCAFSDITNCAASETNREIYRDISAENHFGFLAANALFQSIGDYNQAVADANAYYQSAAYAAAVEAQKQALARAIAANSGGTISYQQAYDSLDPSTGHLQGGNYNFGETLYGPGNLGCGADAIRCNGIHFPDQGFVHLDTSNPFTGFSGFFTHAFVDVFLGNFAYNVIPRPRP